MSEIKVSAGLPPPEACRGASFLPLLALVAVTLGVPPASASVCHMAFSLEPVSEVPSTYRDTSHWVRAHSSEFLTCAPAGTLFPSRVTFTGTGD